jgi:hypothetical protein
MTASSKPTRSRRTQVLIAVALIVVAGGAALGINIMLRRERPIPEAASMAALQLPPGVHSYTYTDCDPEDADDAPASQ